MSGGKNPDLPLYYNYHGQFISSDYYVDSLPEWVKKEESLDSWSSDEEERWSSNAATLEEMEYNGEKFLVDIENGSIYDNWEVIGTWDFESGKPVFYEQKWQFILWHIFLISYYLSTTQTRICLDLYCV